MKDPTERRVRVWDPFVRVFHWTLVIAFFVAFVTEGEQATLHELAGYVVGGLVVVRFVWGFVGTRHARFADFVYRPAAVLAYGLRLVTFRSERYLGHSPLGGAMVVALLVCLALTVGTGILTDQRGEGREEATLVTTALADEDEEGKDEREREVRESALSEIHEVLANLTFLLVILHVGGVILASLAHRENLVRAMFTGDKRA